MTHEDFPPTLTGPRIMPDRPPLIIEINCVCGNKLDSATYIDGNRIKMVVEACSCHSLVEIVK